MFDLSYFNSKSYFNYHALQNCSIFQLVSQYLEIFSNIVDKYIVVRWKSRWFSEEVSQLLLHQTKVLLQNILIFIIPKCNIETTIGLSHFYTSNYFEKRKMYIQRYYPSSIFLRHCIFPYRKEKCTQSIIIQNHVKS